MKDVRASMHSVIRDKCLITDTRKTLSSGAKTDVYFDCKKATLNGEFLSLFALWTLNATKNISYNAVGGPTMGADCMVAAILIESHRRGLPNIRRADNKKG